MKCEIIVVEFFNFFFIDKNWQGRKRFSGYEIVGDVRANTSSHLFFRKYVYIS